MDKELCAPYHATVLPWNNRGSAHEMSIFMKGNLCRVRNGASAFWMSNG